MKYIIYLRYTKQKDIMKNQNTLGVGEVRNSFKYKFASEDAKKSVDKFNRLNPGKLEAIKAAFNR